MRGKVDGHPHARRGVAHGCPIGLAPVCVTELKYIIVHYNGYCQKDVFWYHVANHVFTMFNINVSIHQYCIDGAEFDCCRESREVRESLRQVP